MCLRVCTVRHASLQRPTVSGNHLNSICSGIAICVGFSRIKRSCLHTNGLGWPTGFLRQGFGGPPHRPASCGSRPISTCDYAEMDCVSTRTPRPMVDETATFLKYTPLLVAGLALF